MFVRSLDSCDKWVIVAEVSGWVLTDSLGSCGLDGWMVDLSINQ